VKRVAIIFVVALPFIISFVFLIATKPTAPVLDTPLPNPNGYDKLVAAGKLLQGQPDFYETMTETELATLIASNVEALALVRSAFTNECRVPVKYSFSYDKTKDLDAFRRLAQTMTAEGRLAELRNRPADAARAYLDVIHFGIESGKGGFLVQALIGIAIERTPENHLTNLIASLDAESSRRTAAALELLDSRREDWEDVMDREIMFDRRALPGLKARIELWWETHREVAQTRRKSTKFFYEIQKETRTLAIQFAAHAYLLEKGKPPASIADLVPGYLKAVPKDPITGKDISCPP
jgi:hypothetical protein